LPKIVYANQTCGVPGRTIFSNLALVRDNLDYIDLTNETVISVSVDQELAFDRVDHNFLPRVLRKHGFGSAFCSWISLFHNSFSAIRALYLMVFLLSR